MRHSELITSVLRPLSDTPNQAYLNNVLQVTDVLQWILDQTVPADVQMTSFSISEEFLRRLFLIKQSNLIRSLDLVLDFKATHKTLILWPFISQAVERCYLAPNHSKILLVSNDRGRVSVVMSQNLTRGNRFESGFVSTDNAVFDALHSQVNSLINNQSVQFHDIYTRTIGKD